MGCGCVNALPAVTETEVVFPYKPVKRLDFTKPAYPSGVNVQSVKRVPKSEIEAFKSEQIKRMELESDSEEGKRRKADAACRGIQFSRWAWALQHTSELVNMMRVSGHSDGAIQRMFDGVPMCFSDRGLFDRFNAALQDLAPQVEEQMRWKNVKFVLTGSSVVGFSQNPKKGLEFQPSWITSTEKSDVDVCIQGEGIPEWWVSRTRHGVTGKDFSTTISPDESGLRHGGVDLGFCPALEDFFYTWLTILPGGLQFTFSGEHKGDLVPWEIYVGTDSADADSRPLP